MRLPSPFIRFPLTFDQARLALEVAQFPESAWQAHPQRFRGNSSLPLVATDGGINDATLGPMLPTPHLADCPYICQVLASFDTPIGRSRLMRLAPGARVGRHVDIHHYWHDRVRVHIPVLTHPRVIFTCDEQPVHMAAGEAWLVDTWRQHEVLNASDQPRIHLVFDTVGSSAFWRLARQQGGSGATLPFRPDADATFPTEQLTHATVMPPGELRALMQEAMADVRATQPGEADRLRLAALDDCLAQGMQEWRALWVAHGESPTGWPLFTDLRQRLMATTEPLCGELQVASNGKALASVLRAWLGASLYLPAPTADAA